MLPVIGWAKPTPVDPRNFKNPMLDDILTAVVGPISNFVVAIGAVLILALVKLASPMGRQILSQGFSTENDSFLVPLCLLMYEVMVINVVLGVFNLIPVPPLDGSHVVRHLLPAGALRVYDTVVCLACSSWCFGEAAFLSRLISPAIGFFKCILAEI